MKQIIIEYTAKHLPRKKQCKLSQELFGYLDQSKHGKYAYRRNGLLSGKIIKKIKPGCLLVDSRCKKEIEQIFKERNIKMNAYLV